MEAKLVEVVEPSKDRVKPRCIHFGVCGGCQLQLLPYEKQLEFKRQHVGDSLQRIGKIEDPPVNQIIGCEQSFFYRNKMEFSFGYDNEMKFAAGLHMPNRRYDVLDLKECFLQSEFSVEILHAVKNFAAEKKWKPFKYNFNEGLLRSLFVREGKHTNEVMVNLVMGENLPENFEKDLEELVKILVSLNCGDKKITSLYFSQIISRRGIPKSVKERLLHGKKTLTEKMILKNGDCLEFDILPQAFFQVNTLQGEILYEEVINLATAAGTIGLFLAKHAKQVFGIEISPIASKAANENAKKNNIFNIDFYTGDVSKLINDIKERPSLTVVDPPRQGLTQKIIKQISMFSPNQVIYVSCNPATFARDVLWFKEYGYKLKTVTPVDMFPQTYHIETVSLLER
ncbi:23S rRNA (uracil(1939)-C(5))-methyltransferase RlmD [Candidatus Peregrinibacteria bacterium]|nr:23S rRNA (uracil(1939)-C(5))-methyltransferase RlmD [Candidatus Peregrinibacteria bacterium]